MNDVKTTPLNILLVEDDDGEAKAVTRALRKSRIANPIVRARDGEEALEILRDSNNVRVPTPYILLIDVNMPRMNGHELMEEIRRDPELRNSVGFMLTTSADQTDIHRAYENHVAGYIVKNRVGEDFTDLVAAIESYWRVVEMPA